MVQIHAHHRFTLIIGGDEATVSADQSSSRSIRARVRRVRRDWRESKAPVRGRDASEKFRGQCMGSLRNSRANAPAVGSGCGEACCARAFCQLAVDEIKP